MAAAMLLVAAMLAGLAARTLAGRERFESVPALRRARTAERLWWIVAAILTLLAADRALGLDTRLTDFVRGLFEATGRYDERRSVQRPAVALAGALLGIAAASLLLVHRRAGPAALMAGAAAIALLLVRAIGVISWHRTDAILARPAGPITLGAAAQGLLAAIVMATALAALSRGGKLWIVRGEEDARSSVG